LTERGKEQAKTLVNTLRDIPISVIFSSPILRARETASIVSQSFHLPYQITDALREYDCGILEDRADEESWKQHRKYYEDWTLRRSLQNKPEGGESFIDILNRFQPFIESLKQMPNQDILLIGHGGLFHLMLPHILLNIDDEFVRTHNIGYTECITAELSSNGFACLQWGDIQL
jgi:broad specificity phosphatase PhoE